MEGLQLAVRLHSTATILRRTAAHPFDSAVVCQNEAYGSLEGAVAETPVPSGAESTAGGLNYTAGDPFPSAVRPRTTVVRPFHTAVGRGFVAGEVRHTAA
jgi:hypothetical protein